LDFNGYEHYIPVKFLTDLLIASKHYILNNKIKPVNDYEKLVIDIITSNRVKYWIKETTSILHTIAKNYDLRIIEKYAISLESFNLHEIKHSFNYRFDINELSEKELLYLNISENQKNEIDKLDNNVISILEIATGLGNATSESSYYTTDSVQMESYADVLKVNKSKYCDPLFEYKLSVKSFYKDKEVKKTKKSDELILGIFKNIFDINFDLRLLFKVFGLVALRFIENGGSRVKVYDFIDTSYHKTVLKSYNEIIEFFREDIQLRLFPINNTKALEIMLSDSPGSDVIFLPNTKSSCTLPSGLNNKSINIISSKLSKFNSDFRKVCQLTGGLLKTI